MFSILFLICFAVLFTILPIESLNVYNFTEKSTFLNSKYDSIYEEELQFTESCYQINEQNYRLVWHDEFNRPESLDRDWFLEHEEGYCAGNGNGQEASCNVQQNVAIKNGFLVLSAKYEKFYDRNYTAAKMTSRRFFTRGRYELRAAQPIGRAIRTCMFTVNTNDAYWHESGQIDLMCVKMATDTYRGLYLANSSDTNNIVRKGIYKNIYDFHLYGVEWDEKRLRFFFDDLYSEPVIFNGTENGLNSWHQIRLQIGVGGIYYTPLPTNFNQLYWRCPALVFDYIRIFEKFDNLENNRTNITSCTKYDPLNYRTVNETLKLKEICQDVLATSKYVPEDIQELKSNLMPMLIMLVVTLVLALIIFLFIRNMKLNRRLIRDRERLQEYENIYYEAPHYENTSDLYPKTDSYLQLQDAVLSEYMSIKRSYRSTRKYDRNNCECDDDGSENKYVSIKGKKSSIKEGDETDKKEIAIDQEKLTQDIIKVYLEAKKSLDKIKEVEEIVEDNQLDFILPSKDREAGSSNNKFDIKQ